MRQNGHGTITLEETRTWIEETGLCLFLPKRQFGSSITPTFVEAVCGQRNPTPEPKQIAVAEDMLVRLEKDGVVVRLNLQGLLGEQPDYVVAAWVLPYVYALRGDRDWRRSPQLTGSRQVSPLAVQAYKLLEVADATVPTLKHTLGREVTDAAVARAITELWQQLRIIPMVNAPGEAAKWQLLRHRYQKAIAEGASTSQVTAISVLASIYLQAVIAATMEDVESFLSPLTARSKVREVIRGLVATRQVHTLTLGHAPHFYVAGTLPEFSAPPAYYASSTIGSSGYFLTREEEEASVLRIPATPSVDQPAAQAAPETEPPPAPEVTEKPQVEAVEAPAKEEVAVAPVAAVAPAAPVARPHAVRPPAAPPVERPRFSRPASHSHDRKPASASRPARSGSSEERPRSARPAGARPSGSRPAGARPSGPRPAGGSRPTGSRSAGPRPTGSRPASARPAGSRPASARPAGARPAGSRPAAGARPAGSRPAGSRPAAASHGRPASSARWSSASGSNGNGSSNGSAKRPSSHSAAPSGARSGGLRTAAKPASRTGKPAAKPLAGKLASKPASKAASSSRKPAPSASKGGSAKRFSHSTSARPGAKKRG
ncbi:hypothetical protein ACOBR2_19955 [Telmatobacter bradus]|uniref:hypothetical protein n=1 Tax=Telmatobacter bradus TaxID=474953 RepID=UPI003B432BC1